MESEAKQEKVKQVFSVLYMLIALGFVFYIMAPFIVPSILGAVFAAGLSPGINYPMARGIGRDRASLIVTIGFGLLILVPFLIVLARGASLLHKHISDEKFFNFYEKIRSILHRALEALGESLNFKTESISRTMDTKLVGLENYTSKLITTFMQEFPNFMFQAAIVYAAMYFCLRDVESLRRRIHGFLSTEEAQDQLFTIVEGFSKEVFMTNILTGLAQALIISVSAYFFDAGDFFIVFVVTFISSFIPIIGAAPVGILLAIGLFSEGAHGSGIGMIALSLFAGLADNILRPFLISSGSIEIHPLINFLSIIGGVMTFGFAGLFIGPLVVGICFGAIPVVYKDLMNRGL